MLLLVLVLGATAKHECGINKPSSTRHPQRDTTGGGIHAAHGEWNLIEIEDEDENDDENDYQRCGAGVVAIEKPRSNAPRLSTPLTDAAAWDRRHYDGRGRGD